MFKVLLAILMVAAFGASSFDTCGDHLSPSKEAGVSMQSGGHQASHETSKSTDHGKDHCCQAHCAHVAPVPNATGFIAPTVSSELDFVHFVSYSDPSLCLNTRPPLAA